jgi:hypothetical protein
VAGFLEVLREKYPPLLKPLQQAQASALGVGLEQLVWTQPEEAAYAPGRREEVLEAEILTVPSGLLVVLVQRESSGRVRFRENPDGTIAREVLGEEADFFALSAITRDPAGDLLRDTSEAATRELGIELADYRYPSPRFENLKGEAVIEELPCSEADVAAAEALADRTARTLAVAIKSSRGLLLKDAAKQLDGASDPIEALVEGLVNAGVVTREVVVVCQSAQTQVVRVPDKASLTKLAKSGLRCACGVSIDKEVPEELLSVTDIGGLLIDKSRWLSVLVRERLVALGVPREDILLECQIGAEEVDCIAAISGELAIFELKDKQFSIGNAYSFGAKISVLRPQHSVIVTTDTVGSDVKDHFSRSRGADRGNRFPRETQDAIYYVEGADFTPGLTAIVEGIYAKDGRTILNTALSRGLADAGSLIAALDQPS